MITKKIDENSISVMPEDSDDLLNLRRIIKEDDKIIGDTTRVLKQDKDYSRPDKGERIRVNIQAWHVFVDVKHMKKTMMGIR